MTPDPTLSARLARLRGGEHEAEADGDYDTGDLDQAAGNAYRSGQLITAAVQAAVDAEREACAALIEANMLVGPGGVELLRPRTNPGNNLGFAYAAAIRARTARGPTEGEMGCLGLFRQCNCGGLKPWMVANG